jgi:sodium transport system permease protein
MNGIKTVLKKEILENMRDRRAVFNSLLVGPLLFPLIFIGMMWFTATTQQERAEKTLELPVVGAEHAPNLIRFLEQQGTVIKPPPEDPEGAVQSQEEPVVIRVTEEFAEKWQKGESAPIEVISDPSRQESEVAIRRVKQLLAVYGQQIGVLRLRLRGVAPQLTAPIQVREVDLSTAKSRAILAMIFLPYLLMITAFTGGSHIAMDTTAGEKERRSLEPLLINPVPRWEVMAGKLLATMLFAMASLTLTLISFKIVLPLMPVGSFGMNLNLDLTTMVLILLVIAPVAIMASSLLTMLAAFAKTYREAQSYVGLMVLVPMVPSIIFMSNPIKPDTMLMSIPLFSQNLLIGEIVRGETVPLLWYGLSIGSMLVIGLILATFAATLYNRPRLIFGGP